MMEVPGAGRCQKTSAFRVFSQTKSPISSKRRENGRQSCRKTITRTCKGRAIRNPKIMGNQKLRVRTGTGSGRPPRFGKRRKKGGTRTGSVGSIGRYSGRHRDQRQTTSGQPRQSANLKA